jgi:putative addiction module CopG family antidote
MTIHLSKDLEQFVRDAVRAGLYAREDDVIRDALARLRQATPQAATARPRKNARRIKTATPPAKNPLSIEEIHQQMLASGLLTSLPDPSLDIDDDDPGDRPVPIKGEPLSETILRERR